MVTVVGNLTADPELKFTPNGQPVANFTVASTTRFWDRETNGYKDGDTLFMRCNVWRETAENVAESLARGNRVMVTGRLKQRSYETKEGEKRSVTELEVDEVGPSLKWATVKVNRTEKTDSKSSTRTTTKRDDSPWGSGSDPWSDGGSPSNDGQPPF